MANLSVGSYVRRNFPPFTRMYGKQVSRDAQHGKHAVSSRADFRGGSRSPRLEGPHDSSAELSTTRATTRAMSFEPSIAHPRPNWANPLPAERGAWVPLRRPRIKTCAM
jgi:hypothetical protein